MRLISDLAPRPAGQPITNELTLGDTLDRSLLRSATFAPVTDPASVDPAGTTAALVQPGDRYRVHEVLGSGGMGEVRLCHDAAVGRDVALKTLLPACAGRGDAEQRFLREARVQGQLEHPSTVPVYDLGTDAGGALFFTMRRVRGHTLAQILADLRRGDGAMVASYSRRKLLSMFSQLCLAVDYAHNRGVLHRDLKPSNIMPLENRAVCFPGSSERLGKD